MRRKTFDSLIGSAALLLVAVLAVAGGLRTWGHSYISRQVHAQSAAQQIYFPAASSPAISEPQFADMRQYAGEQLTTGAQAKVYADDFSANHLEVIGGGKTHAQVSAEAEAQPGNTKLAATATTLFQGETLRGLLLNAYAFGTMGTIAGIAAIAALADAALLLLLSALGLCHSRRVSSDEQLFASDSLAPSPALASA